MPVEVLGLEVKSEYICEENVQSSCYLALRAYG